MGEEAKEDTEGGAGVIFVVYVHDTDGDATCNIKYMYGTVSSQNTLLEFKNCTLHKATYLRNGLIHKATYLRNGLISCMDGCLEYFNTFMISSLYCAPFFYICSVCCM